MSDMHITESLIDNFTMVGNLFTRDPNVTPRAARLYIYLMSHATGWKLSIKAAQNATGMGRGTVYSAINDLRKLGYIRRIDMKNENGHFSGTQYQVLAHPLPEHERDDVEGKTISRVPENEKRNDQQKQDETPGGNRLPEIGIPEDGIPEDVTLKNNNLKKNNFKKTKDQENMLISDEKSEHVSHPEESQEPKKQESPPSQKKTQAEKYPQDFLDWYAIYPRKKAKGDALKAYKQALKEIDHDELVEKTRKYARYVEQSQTLQRYVPYPASWLRAAQWDDEQEPPEELNRTQAGYGAPGAPSPRDKSAEQLMREQWAREDALLNNNTNQQPQPGIFEWPYGTQKEIER